MLFPTTLTRSTSGTAAAEMALVSPLLIILMFGAFELGNYFLSEHVVVKAVRDGARYASRLNFSNYPCTGASANNTPSGTVVDDTRNLVRTGQVASGGTARLTNWSSGTTITVSYDCIAAGSASPSYTGIYLGKSFVPVVRVSVQSLDYYSLFNNVGLSSSTLTLNAEAKSAVMGA